MKGVIRSLVFIVVLFNVVTMPVVYGQVINAEDMADLKTHIQHSGNATVIVEYQDSFSDAASMHGLGETALRNSINADKQRFETSLSAHAKAGIDHSFAYVPAAVLTVDAAMLEELESNSMIKAVYPNKMLKPTLAESVDIVFRKHDTSAYSGSDWAVAVLDTGVDKNHTFLKNGATLKVISEACYSGGGSSSQNRQFDRFCPGNLAASIGNNTGLHCTGYSGCDHGTHVAGIAVGNGADFGGVAAGGNLIAIQVFTGLNDVYELDPCKDGSFSCVRAAYSDVLKGLERVYALHETYQIAAVNLSLGGGYFSSSCGSELPAMTAIINLLKEVNIATIVASGNDGFRFGIGFPACIPNAIAVGATADISTSFFTLDKPTSYSNIGPELDLYAPGSLIRSSIPGNGYANFIGTSMAAPHVAGAFAVIRQAVPDATVDQILSVLKTVGPNVTNSVSSTARRRLDVRAALLKLGIGEGDITPILKLLLLDET